LKKKEKSTVTVVVTILFLSLFIILPPLFRSMFPASKEILTPEMETLTVLNCTKDVASELFRVTTRAVYTENGFKNTTLTYTSFEDDDELSFNQLSGYSALQELEIFRSLPEVNIQEIDNTRIIKLDSTYAKNPSTLIQSHIMDITDQKKLYETAGFTCNIQTIES